MHPFCRPHVDTPTTGPEENFSLLLQACVYHWIPGDWLSDGSGTGVSSVCRLHDSHGRDARATTLTPTLCLAN